MTLRPPSEPDVVARTIAGACHAYSISPRSIYRLITAGRLKVHKFGRRTLLLDADLRAVLGLSTSISTPENGTTRQNTARPGKRRYQRSSKFRRLRPRNGP